MDLETRLENKPKNILEKIISFKKNMLNVHEAAFTGTIGGLYVGLANHSHGIEESLKAGGKQFAMSFFLAGLLAKMC